MMNNKYETMKRLFNDYTRKHIKKIFLAVFFSILVAGSTSGIAYLLDPAIEKIFINQDETLISFSSCRIFKPLSNVSKNFDSSVLIVLLIRSL